MKEHPMNERIIAKDRDETDTCEAGTPGCCINHIAKLARPGAFPFTECETW
jgi:hypothetical protein